MLAHASGLKHGGEGSGDGHADLSLQAPLNGVPLPRSCTEMHGLADRGPRVGDFHGPRTAAYIYIYVFFSEKMTFLVFLCPVCV